MNQDMAPHGGSWVWRSPAAEEGAEEGLEEAESSSAHPEERQLGGRHARRDNYPKTDSWESASDLDGGFQQVAPGVVYVPTSPHSELLDPVVAPASSPGAIAGTGVWEGSSRPPSRRARGCQAGGKPRRAVQPVISRRRITWAGIIGTAIAFGAVLLLGAGVRPSGAAPPVVGGPDESISDSGAASQISPAGQELVLDAAPGADSTSRSPSGEHGESEGGEIAPTPAHDQLVVPSADPGDRPTRGVTERSTGQPTERSTGQPTEQPTEQPTKTSAEQHKGQPRERPTKPPMPDSSISLGSPKPSPVAGQPVESEPDWQEVIIRLDRVRAKSLTQLDDTVLAGAVAPGSPAWAADTALLAALRARGLHPRGLRTQVVAVVRLGESTEVENVTASAAVPAEPVLSRGSGVILLVTDRRAGYQLVDDEGAVVDRIGEAGKAHWQVRLIPARTEIGWLISDVAAQS